MAGLRLPSFVSTRRLASLAALSTLAAGAAVAAPSGGPLAPRAAAAASAAGKDVTEAPNVVSAQRAAAAAGHRVEVTGERSETSSTYANPDGTLTTEASTSPRWVPGSDGWTPVDTTLTRDSSGVHAKAVPVPTVLADGGTADAVASSFPGGKTVGLRWASSLPAPTLSGSTATYPNVLPGTDLTVAVGPDGYELSLVVRARPAAPLGQVKLPLHLAGLTAAVTAGGNLQFRDANGTVVAQAPPAVMFDASAGAAGPRTAPVAMSVSGGNLVLTPDASFMSDPATVFPVTIDPSISYGRASDTYIQASNSTTNFAGSTGLLNGSTNGGADRARTMMTFDTNNIAGKHVLSATLGMWNYASGTCYTGTASVDALNIFQITGAWSPSAVTWSNNTATISSTATAQIQKSLQPNNASCPVGTVTADLTSLVQSWANGTSNYGVEMAAASDSNSAGYRNYYSGEHNGGQPSLSVTYNSYPNTVGGRSTTPSTVSGSTTYTNDATPTLHGAALDVDGGQTRVDFEIWNGTGTTRVAYGSTAMVSENTNVAWSPPTTLADGSYEWRARGYDGTDYSKSWSSWIPFTVDTQAPPATTVSSTAYPSNGWNTAGGPGTFTFTNPGGDFDHYLYDLDNPTPSTVWTSNSLTLTPGDGWHTLSVRTVDHAGNVSAVTSYSFGATPGLTSPTDGQKTQGSLPLTSRAAPGYTQVTYNYRRSPADPWAPIPAGDVTDANSQPIPGWPVTFTATGDSIPPTLNWNLAQTLADKDGPVQVQVCFGTACSTAAVNLTLDENAFGDSYATTDLGPGSVSLLTGNYSVAASDVSVPAYNSTLSVGRTFNSFTPTTTGIFGPGWQPSLPVEDANSDWSALTDTGNAVTLTGSDGSITSFAKTTGGYTATGDDADSGLTLTATGDVGNGAASFTLNDYGNQTTFTAGTLGSPPSLSTPHTYLVSKVTQPGSSHVTNFGSFMLNGKSAPAVIVAPAPSATTICDNETIDSSGNVTWPNNVIPVGCRALELHYSGGVVTSVTLDVNTGSGQTQIDVACYHYNPAGQLDQAWDPRDGTSSAGTHPVACGNPVLATGYGYDTAGRLATVTPPGLAAWNLAYDNNRLSTVSRTHDSAHGGGTETSTLKYDVPRTPNADYSPNMVAGEVARWAQTDAPVTATAVFGPGDNPSSTDLRDGEVHYLDVNGREVNTASYANGWHITTTEYDARGNTTRTLDAADREEALSPTTGAGAALGLPADTAAAALALSTQNLYTTASDGVDDLTDSYGPYHLVTVPGGGQVGARLHTAYTYDGKGNHLETSRVTAASESTDTNPTNEQDSRQTDTAYELTAGEVNDGSSNGDTTGWTFRQPMKVVEDPAGIGRATINRYDANTGAPTESRMPSNAPGAGAGTTQTIYYTADTNSRDSACGNKPAWASLLCETKLAGAATPTVSGMPGLVTHRVTAYDWYARATTTQDSVVDGNGVLQTRTVTTHYLNSDYGTRVSSVAVTGGLGAAVPTHTTSYDGTTGLPTSASASATAENPATSASTGYDDFGRVTSYTDADEATGATRNTTTTSYDAAGRVATTADAHTTTTYSYNGAGEHRGLPTGLTVSVSSSPVYTGGFTAAYDANGALATQTDPNGVTEALTRDETGQLTALTDTKGGAAWLTETVTPSIYGQWSSDSNDAGVHNYTYDKLGRLTQADDTPTGGACTTRAYTFDADSNRASSTRYGPAADNTCQTTTGDAPVNHSYDTADRLLGVTAGGAATVDNGIAYDAYGRTTTLPAADAGGTAVGNLTNTFYANDLVRSQTQSNTTKCWTLDAAMRLKRFTTYSGSGCAGTAAADKTNHYDGGSGDSPDWIAETADATQWTANITDLTGGLAVTVNQAGTINYQYDNLHGDILATAAPGAATATISSDYDEYGNPADGQQRRYGWLGGKQRSGEALGGIVLMGVRLYAPVLGRFLSVDGINGGNANAYDYVNQDPVNAQDLDGRFCLSFDCWKKSIKRWLLNHVGSWVGSGVKSLVSYIAGKRIIPSREIGLTLRTLEEQVSRVSASVGGAIAGGVGRFVADVIGGSGYSWQKEIARVVIASVIGSIAGALIGILAANFELGGPLTVILGAVINKGLTWGASVASSRMGLGRL